MELKSGDKLGPYEVLSPLGKGGMGEVWKAHDPRLRRDVAIKTSAGHFPERFEREAHAIAALNHPNICQIYDVGPNYLVMEYIEGTPLKGPLPLDQALKYAAQISAPSMPRTGPAWKSIGRRNCSQCRHSIPALERPGRSPRMARDF
jgi:serine/threonine protein kinase